MFPCMRHSSKCSMEGETSSSMLHPSMAHHDVWKKLSSETSKNALEGRRAAGREGGNKPFRLFLWRLRRRHFNHQTAHQKLEDKLRTMPSVTKSPWKLRQGRFSFASSWDPARGRPHLTWRRGALAAALAFKISPIWEHVASLKPGAMRSLVRYPSSRALVTAASSLSATCRDAEGATPQYAIQEDLEVAHKLQPDSS